VDHKGISGQQLDYIKNLTYPDVNRMLKERDSEIERLRRALKKIEDRTNDPVARSIAGEALVT
jgi:hypothetical protein